MGGNSYAYHNPNKPSTKVKNQLFFTSVADPDIVFTESELIYGTIQESELIIITSVAEPELICRIFLY